MFSEIFFKIGLIIYITIVAFTIVDLDDRVELLENQKMAINMKLEKQQEKVANILNGLNLKSVDKLTVTAYSPRNSETDNTPKVTASMSKVRHGGVAVSRDLFKDGWVFGKKVYIEGYGIYAINDLMNKRFENRIDIFMWDTEKALNFGKKELVVALME